MKIKNVFLILVMGFSFLTVGYVFSSSNNCAACTEDCSLAEGCFTEENVLLAQLKIEKIENPDDSDSLKKDLPRVDTSKANKNKEMKEPVLEIDDSPVKKSPNKRIKNKQKEENGIEINTGIIPSEGRTNEDFKKEIEEKKKIAEEKKKVFINQLNCVGCGQCTDVCPVSAIEIIGGKAVIDYEKCISCYLCIRECNYRAIKKKKD